MAKAAFWHNIDAEGRKRGERTGLDTLVVHAVNDEYLMVEDSTLSLSELTVKYSAWGLRPQG